MMDRPDVLVVGAGPAGMAASAELARQGLSVLMVEQRDQMGGAIYRRPADGHRGGVSLPAHHRRQRDALARDVVAAGPRLSTMLQSVLLGIDRDGRVLIDNRCTGRVVGVRPRALVLAVGCVERIQPRPGWELPGVVTAGGLQVLLKETCEAPPGPLLLAGNGPLLLALGAQLCAAGNPPLAVLERGSPFGNAFHAGGAVLDMLRSPTHLQEAFGYAAQLARAGVPYLTGWDISAIRVPEGASGSASAELLEVSGRPLDGHGEPRVWRVHHLALHDGLNSNTTGLPGADACPPGLDAIERAGDCREVLGAFAAVIDGRRVGAAVAARLGRGTPDPALAQALAQARRTQAAVTQLFQAPALEPAPDTVICRCEGLRRRDFEQMQGADSARELRLVGRFGMGACQGRFCAHAISELARAGGTHFEPGALNGEILRWPLRPVSLAALAAYTEPAGDAAVAGSPACVPAPASSR